MPKEHEVKQGECISSIAEKYGLFPETIWDDAANAELKEKRKDPNVLYLGDVVVIPDKREKEESGATENRHRFRRKGNTENLEIQLLDEGTPRANENYILDVDGKLLSGTTDARGRLKEIIPSNAKKGKLLVGDEQEEYMLDLGYLDPIDQISGIQARLNNLGYDCGAVDGELNPETKEMLEEFQEKHDLQVTGEADDQTRAKLLEEHGC
jgi:N-acetylmuramoyl-L-alanine amidase